MKAENTKALSNKGSINIIIPTAGLDIERLDRCISGVELAANNINYHISLILCPGTNEKIKKIEKKFGTRIHVISIDAPFNYCSSINLGIRNSLPEDRYVLFLNDDVTFLNVNDIKILRDTLDRTSWACVGPYILYNPDVHDETWPKEKSNAHVERRSTEIRTIAPISGCCMLWDRNWLNYVGFLDEEFGKGWGMDEADMCLRTARLGGQFGRQDLVAIRHIMHASFGSDFTKYTGAPHMFSLNYFHKKYGNEVHEWGKSEHWDLLFSKTRAYYLEPRSNLSFAIQYNKMINRHDLFLEDSRTLSIYNNITCDIETNKRDLHSLPTSKIHQKDLSEIDENIRKLCKQLKEYFPSTDFTFSGSVIKDTFVYGSSDIDILFLSTEWINNSPAYIVSKIEKILNKGFTIKNLTNHLIIDTGLNINIDLVPGYTDPIKWTLLIPDITGTKWISANPELFILDLNKLDSEMSGIVRPTIRLVKFFYSSYLPKSKIPGHYLEVVSYKVAINNRHINSVPILFEKIITDIPSLAKDILTDSSNQFTQIDFQIGDKNDPRRKAFIEELNRALSNYNQNLKK